MNKGPVLITIGALFIAAASCGVGVAIGSGDTTTASSPAPTVTVTAKGRARTVTARPTATATVTTAPEAPKAAITEGTWVVGEDIPAGSYKTSEPVSEGCYWSIMRSGTNGADIVQNDLPSGGIPRVTLKRGQDFKTQSCGDWIKA